MIRFAVLTLLVVAAACAHTQETSAPVSQGRRLFQDQGCYGCHTVGATGTPIGPDLSHIGAKRNRSYMIDWLRDPSSPKPTAHMPRLTLTEAEVQALATYLGSLR